MSAGGGWDGGINPASAPQPRRSGMGPAGAQLGALLWKGWLCRRRHRVSEFRLSRSSGGASGPVGLSPGTSAKSGLWHLVRKGLI